MRSLIKKVVVSVPFLLFAGITIVDALLYFAGHIPEFVRLLRDGILLFVLVLMLPLRHRMAIFQERRTFLVLRNVFFIVVAAFAILFLVDTVFPPIVYSSSGFSLLHTSMKHFIIGTAAALLLTFLVLFLLGFMRVLVLYKSKHASMRNFRLLLLSFLIVAAVSSAQGRTAFYDFSPFDRNLVLNVALGFMFLMIVMNCFRTSWMHSLNRKQKWGLFFAAIVASVLSASVVANIEESFVMHYSVAYASLVKSGSLFFSLYAGLSAALLLLHLPTARVYDEKINALKTMQELTKSISHFMEKERLMELVTQRALDVTDSNWGWLATFTEEGEERTLALGASCNLTEDEQLSIPLDHQNQMISWVIKKRMSSLINDIAEKDDLVSWSEWKPEIGALLIVPLVSLDHVFGILCAGKKDSFSYDNFDQDLLQGLADQAAIAIQNANLLEASIEKERLAQELRVAQEAQAKLLPKDMPQLAGIEVSGVSIAAYEVGGDYYDVFEIGDKLAVVVGDVSGKGTAAAFYMAQVKGVIEALGRFYSTPKEIIIHANRILSRSLEKNLFISLIYAIFDPEEQKMTLSRAGHNPLIWCPQNGEPRVLQPNGLGIGLAVGEVFETALEEVSLPISTGDFFVFYTDGVVEARDCNNVEFEEERLLEQVRKAECKHAVEMRDSILLRVYEHVGSNAAHDDFTLLVVGINPDGVAASDASTRDEGEPSTAGESLPS